MSTGRAQRSRGSHEDRPRAGEPSRADRQARAAERQARAAADEARAAEYEARAAALAGSDEPDDRSDREGRRDHPERPPRPPRRERAQRAAPSGSRDPAPRSRSDLLARVLVALPLAFIAIVFVDIGGTAWAVLMAVVSVLCLVELYRMLARWRPAALVGYVGAVGLIAAARWGTDRTVLEVTMATIPLVFVAVVAERRENMPTVSIAGTLLGIVWVGLGFAHAELLRQLPHGGSIVIDVMLGTFLADTGAYLGGRMFGHTPLAPAISPHKTFEGLALGMFTAVVAVFVAGRFQQTWLSEGDSLLLGLTVAVLGPLGDLFESLVKRDAGAKDAGSLFGAHGGALDRLDAVIFTAVGGYYVWLALLH